MSRMQAVLDYWEDMGPEGWFGGGPEVDAAIRERFEGDWHDAMAGRLDAWRCGPRRTLAYLILTDQMSRNMFRDTAAAYASDARARAAAFSALSQGWDMQVEPRLRFIFYMPFEHSESLTDQERSVRLFLTRLPEEKEYLLHARAHREVIRRFGRFPFRNDHLGRRTTGVEQEFLDAGAYGAVVRELKAA